LEPISRTRDDDTHIHGLFVKMCLEAEAAGVYFYRLELPEQTAVRKMTFAK
jgi:hypothetical protein